MGFNIKGKRTEHAGGKNGRGYYGKRVVAKRESRKERRRVDRLAAARRLR